jgi:hypothetical protein
LYGIEYLDYGFSIYAHFPHYRFEKDSGWGFTSVLLTDEYAGIFHPESADYSTSLRALAAMFRMKGHTYFLLKKLSEWKRSEEALVVLQSLAFKERPNLTWNSDGMSN